MKRGGESEQAPLWRRLAWLVIIWGLSVTALGLLAYLIRLIMNSVGLSS
ncbi:DUF2474 domain-containing protein [Stutzerimonas tarimensis]|uniref:DUF2474 domain-containing protein n=1 Tax=Stutzerimonas tarimensis TaxID=1507735 RepID=A0ABV7T1V1_9GAMM